MTAIAGVDVGNATTEVVIVADGAILGAGRAPTRGRKGSPESLRAAAALVRRVARQSGATVDQARIAPLRPVDTSVRIVPDAPPPTGRLRVLAAGVATPGGASVGIGVPLLLGKPAGTAGRGAPVIVVVPPETRYDHAAAAIRELVAAGTRVAAVLVAGDEAVLVANRLPAAIRGVPLIDQVDPAATASCSLLAVEVRPPGHPLTTLADPMALGAAFGLGERDLGDAAAISRSLLDYSNAVVGLTTEAMPAPPPAVPDPSTGRDADLDDTFTVDLAAAAEAATARRGSLGRAVLVAVLHRQPADAGSAATELARLLGIPVTTPLTEPAAARLGAATTPGILPGALVADIGSGTIDAIAADGREAVVAGAGELLTVAVAEALGVPRAAADWIKRGPCVRLDGGQRYEAEDGGRGFLDVPAPAAAAGMLAVPGPGGLLPFAAGSGRQHTPSEWRAIRLRLKQAVLAVSLQRALTALGEPGRWLASGSPAQLVLVGGPAADDELVGVLTRSLPDTITVGRGNLGAARDGEALGHRYAVALGLALA
jgi:Diol dehydratase reactivase ATPase-like domain/DD-reactivating factor swiveling domain